VPLSRGRAALAIALGLAGVVFAAPLSATAANTAPVRMTVIVPMTVPATETGLIPLDALALYTQPQGLLTRELAAVADRDVAIAIDPMIIVSIRVLGSSAPDTALQWLDKLANVTNQTFPLAYGDSDVTLATQAGYFGVLSPESLDFAIDPRLFAPVVPEPTDVATAAPTPVPTPTPTPTPDPNNPPLPTTEELLAWPYTLTSISWPRESTVIASDLPAIAAGGYSTTILSSDNVAAPAGSGSVLDVDHRRVLVSDAAVSDAVRLSVDSMTDEAYKSAATTIAAAGAAQPDGAVVVATLDRTVPAIASRLDFTLSKLEQDSSIELVPLTTATSALATSGSVVDRPQGTDRLEQADRMLTAATAEASFASAAVDPSLITSERRIHLLGLFSTAWMQKASRWPDAVDEFMAASRTLRESVHLVESSDFLLVADSNQYLPITVRNDLTQAVTVYVTVRSDSGLLIVTNSRVELPVEPASQAKVNVPVRSLSNGVVRVTVTLASGADVPLGSPISSRVNVQAGWETPVVVVVALLVVIAFGVGIVRTILRRRRARG
jgi:hypothetical protein